jgi:sterol desaturase/sphingolipid hydroxylase (fatty acid hydroxylase superfamily)
MAKFNFIAIVLLLVAFAIEFTLLLLQRPEKKMIKDVKANLLIGLCLLIVGVFIKGVQLSLYSFAYSFAVFKPEYSWWLWIVGFLSCDLIHYTYHWLGHHTRIFWAAHVTHHSSEYLNLSTGWRTNFFHLFYRFLFWTPLCFLGLPPEMVILIEAITAIHNYLIHTEKVGKLGVIDLVFNTPSNHRVHHGVNPEYLDKNIGGLLMIYDHLFGTYAKETTPAIYGITHNINTQNPVIIITHEYARLKKELPKIKGAVQKIRYLFSAPT